MYSTVVTKVLTCLQNLTISIAVAPHAFRIIGLVVIIGNEVFCMVLYYVPDFQASDTLSIKVKVQTLKEIQEEITFKVKKTFKVG